MDPLVEQILEGVDERLLATSEGRRALCEMNPVLFAIIYFPHSLKNDEGEITLAECHLEWAEIAKRWAKAGTRKPAEDRHAFIAPRETGKSTWWFRIFPIWWMAYGYSSFIAAFAHSDSQAQMHLANYKHELDTNKVLRQDFLHFCQRGKRPNGVSDGDAKGIRMSKNGCAFVARGIDSTSLGMNIRDMRPDTLLLDDIEPDESNYSLYQMEGRLDSILSSIFPMNVKARCVISGTTTMPGSIVHQMIKHHKGYRSDQIKWVEDENIQVHHARPILTDSHTQQERSMWPSKWDIDWLRSQRHTRSFKKNYDNDPMAFDSEYWSPEDFTYGVFECTKTLISVDGAVTTGKKSDYTGIAVVGYCPPDTQAGETIGKCLVKFAKPVKLRGDDLRAYVLRLLEMYPEVGGILCESNQGGEMWHETFHNMPAVKVKTIHHTDRKETRAARALNFYQLSPTRVYHTDYLTEAEEQMCAFPDVPNDDLVDCIGTGVLAYLRPVKNPQIRARTRAQV